MTTAVSVQDVVEVDAEFDERESSYGEEISSYSTSVSSSVKAYEWKNGRRYHSYQSGSYQFPNDEAEQDRLDMFHHCVVYLACKGKLFEAPIEHLEGLRVLDIGTGTGIWAIEMGRVPPNVKFYVDDVEAQWTNEQPYDFIHVRYMAASIKDWPNLVKNCFDNLKPGGWVEFQEANVKMHSEDGSLKPDNKVVEMLDLVSGACEKMGRELNPGPRLEDWVKDAGFINVEHKLYKLPVGTWPKDKAMKQIGALMTLQYTEGVDAFTNGLFTQVLGWSKEEVTVFNAEVRAAALDRKVHGLHNYHIVYAQKPGE
ncbi:hypothetical protein FQN50_007606 [Emmonsiellopsis sp. PD_5]|nr:hypothetical protein FQN50_007606 [Emmonsiellopsis sp. PD_5]